MGINLRDEILNDKDYIEYLAKALTSTNTFVGNLFRQYEQEVLKFELKTKQRVIFTDVEVLRSKFEAWIEKELFD